MIFKVILWLAIALAGLIAALVINGFATPADHTASVTRSLSASPENVWNAVSAFESYPHWRTGLEAVEVTPPTTSSSSQPLVGLVFRETGEGDPMTFEVLEAQPPSQDLDGGMVVRIADESLGFGGTWTYLLEPSATGSAVTITEDGYVTQFMFRMFSRFMSKTATMERYLDDLEIYLD